MKLRFRLLLLAALVILVVAGSVAAREETKPQDGDESTDLEAGGDKSKKQKDDIQIDSGKARVKQKWQRYKPPSSKKAKKAALRKEKALAKSGKEKWKASAEEVKAKKAKRSAQYAERDTVSKQKPTKKDKSGKENKEKSLQAERQQPSGEGKRLNVDKLRQGLKMAGKQAKKDKWKSSEDSSACAKDELCSSSSESVGSEKKKWKKKNSGEEGTRGKSAQLNTVGDENSSDETGSIGANGRMEEKSDKNTGEEAQGEVLKQRTTEGSKQAAKPKGKKSAEVPATQLDSPEVSASKLKAAKVDKQEDADGALEEADEEDMGGVGKNSSDNRKVKRSYIVEEEYDPECISCSDGSVTDDKGETESSNRKTVRSLGGQSRIRRYIVEEEIIEEGADGEQDVLAGDEMPRLMQ